MGEEKKDFCSFPMAKDEINHKIGVYFGTGMEWETRTGYIKREEESEMTPEWIDMPSVFLCTAGYLLVSRAI